MKAYPPYPCPHFIIYSVVFLCSWYKNYKFISFKNKKLILIRILAFLNIRSQGPTHIWALPLSTSEKDNRLMLLPPVKPLIKPLIHLNYKKYSNRFICKITHHFSFWNILTFSVYELSLNLKKFVSIRIFSHNINYLSTFVLTYY